jgi:hypothetical protein
VHFGEQIKATLDALATASAAAAAAGLLSLLLRSLLLLLLLLLCLRRSTPEMPGPAQTSLQCSNGSKHGLPGLAMLLLLARALSEL